MNLKLKCSAAALAALFAMPAFAETLPTVVTCNTPASAKTSLSVGIVETSTNNLEALIVQSGHVILRQPVRLVTGSKSNAYLDTAGGEKTFGLFVQMPAASATLIHIAPAPNTSISQRGLDCRTKSEIAFQ